MPPIEIATTRTGGMAYGNPFIGPSNHTVPVRVDVSALTADMVDARGYLKPGVFLRRNGLPVTAVATAGEFVYGVTVEPVKVAASNAAGDLAAAVDIDVAVSTICAVNRAIVEDILGRALNAGELAAVDAAGSRVVLVF